MLIQSLSIVVPAKKCINNCAFCVSHMRCEEYKNQMDSNLPFYDLYERDYKKRLEFARDNGCNTIMLTGNAEPQQNKTFLSMFGSMNASLSKPFRWIEMQTTGVLLDEGYLRFLRNHVGVSTISLSLSNMFYDSENAAINRTPHGCEIDIKRLCALIKKYDFNLRLSLNISDVYNCYGAHSIVTYAKDFLNADQLTIRKLYKSELGTEQDKWIEEHQIRDDFFERFNQYVKAYGKPIRRLEYGAMVYSCGGMSIVIDDDCMAQGQSDHTELKYLILRPDCKLYSSWDDRASLIF